MKHLNWYVRNSQHYVISINRKSRYWTNDQESKYFPEKYIADLCTPDDKWYKEYFVNQTEVFKWFEVISGQSVESITEILAIAEQRKDENDNSFCNIYEYAAG